MGRSAVSKLGWGETPWDNMSKEQLLKEVQRMYSAVNSLQSCLLMEKQDTLYWGKQGMGGRALEKGKQVIESVIHHRRDAEALYRAFFRYADNLLFDHSTGYQIGSGWRVCPKCREMRGASPDGVPVEICNKCEEILLPLTWDDLKPQERIE